MYTALATKPEFRFVSASIGFPFTSFLRHRFGRLKQLDPYDSTPLKIVLGEELMSILCEGLGVKSDRLNKLSCLDARKIVRHYYPKCLQPELTVGLTSHTDPGVLTVLVQNEVGRLLQVKCGEDWVDIEAVPGAIIINIGDR